MHGGIWISALWSWKEKDRAKRKNSNKVTHYLAAALLPRVSWIRMRAKVLNAAVYWSRRYGLDDDDDDDDYGDDDDDVYAKSWNLIYMFYLIWMATRRKIK